MFIEFSVALFIIVMVIYLAIKVGKLEERLKEVEGESKHCKYTRENRTKIP